MDDTIDIVIKKLERAGEQSQQLETTLTVRLSHTIGQVKAAIQEHEGLGFPRERQHLIFNEFLDGL